MAIKLNKRKYLLSIAFLIYLSESSVSLANENRPEWGPWSVSLSSPSVEKNIQNIRGDGADTRISSPKYPFIWALKLYRKFISPVSGNRCQMYPTCSHYSLLALEKHGPFLGTVMTADRLMRCNPSCAESHSLIYRGNRYRCYDPVENNDFWLTSSEIIGASYRNETHVTLAQLENSTLPTYRNPDNSEEGLKDPEKLFSFADYLYAKEDYYRAITEYERVIFLYPNHPLSIIAKLKIALAYQNAGKWEIAINNLQKIAEDYPDQESGKEAFYRIGETYCLKGDYQLAIGKFRSFIGRYPEDDLREKAQVMLGWCHLRNKSSERAIEEFKQVETDSPLYSTAAGLAQDAGDFPNLPRKSPALAGVLSIIPGAGQIYTGRIQDGVVSFILNGLFIWGTYEAFDHGNNVAGGILLLFESGWYSGNIYGAISGAHKYNRNKADTYFNSLEEKYDIPSLR